MDRLMRLLALLLLTATCVVAGPAPAPFHARYPNALLAPQGVYSPPIVFQNHGTPIGVSFTFNCSTNTTCTMVNGVLTLTATGGGGGSGCVPPGVQYSLLTDDGLGGCSVEFGLGTTTSVLHGNASGLPSFDAVNLAMDVTGQLPISAVGSAGLSGSSPIGINSAGAITCSTCNTSSATVSSIATTSPIGGGTITTTGTITCTTCVTSASALTANEIVLGAGSQASAVLASLGTTSTVLHGNATGAPSFGAVALATDVSGQLPIAAVGSSGLSGTSPVAISAAGAISCTTCNTSAATVTSIATTAPLSGGTITTSGTISITGVAGEVLAGATPAFTATPTLGASGTLGSITLGNATSSGGTMTVEPVTGSGLTGIDYFPIPVNTPATLVQTLCSGTITLPNGTAIGSNTKYGASSSAPQQTACTNLATTDEIHLTFNGDPTSTTGYVAGAMLTIIVYPTAGEINLYLVNNTGSSITPSSATVNYRVVR